MIGTGIDVVSIERIERLIERESFLRRVFTEGELRSASRRARYLAGYLSVKEACIKALSNWSDRGVRLKDIEVIDKDGRKYVRLHNVTLKDWKVFASIAFSKTHAYGFVLLKAKVLF